MYLLNLKGLPVKLYERRDIRSVFTNYHVRKNDLEVIDDALHPYIFLHTLHQDFLRVPNIYIELNPT